MIAVEERRICSWLISRLAKRQRARLGSCTRHGIFRFLPERSYSSQKNGLEGHEPEEVNACEVWPSSRMGTESV
jgi:hypothetical protein